RLYADADTSCSRRNHRSMRDGDERRNIHETMTSSTPPNTKPITGERKMKSTVLPMPDATSEPKPTFATAAPMRPPINACDDDEGRPKNQVIAFHEIAPMSAPKIT